MKEKYGKNGGSFFPEDRHTVFRKGRYLIPSAVLLYLGAIICSAAVWFHRTFDVGIDAVLYTVFSSLHGANVSVLKKALGCCLVGIILASAVLAILLWMDCILVKRTVGNRGANGENAIRRRSVIPIYRVGTLLICVIFFCGSLVYSDRIVGLAAFLSRRSMQTHIYEEEYVDPDSVGVTVSVPQKNLLLIYMESLETTYASIGDGGCQPENNYIPHLTELAADNISFSDGTALGGWYAVTGTTWTMGSLFATATGVPFAFPIDANGMSEQQFFAAGITSLGDILLREGYQQEFLCGSDASFAGKREFFEQHGGFSVFDLNTARERGYIPESYHVWWGFEDKILYEIAKDELTRLHREGKPFNLTMLTVDTHPSGGYVCSLCEDKYPQQLANVFDCADRQIDSFISWCRKQPFFEDTVIVIVGDHPQMESPLVEGTTIFDRSVYNCIINSGLDEMFSTDRVFTAMDMFPTILASMGFSWEGNRLGIGTNMFSGEKTLAEELGYEEFNNEVSKSSVYYISRFS